MRRESSEGKEKERKASGREKGKRGRLCRSRGNFSYYSSVTRRIGCLLPLSVPLSPPSLCGSRGTRGDTLMRKVRPPSLPLRPPTPPHRSRFRRRPPRFDDCVEAGGGRKGAPLSPFWAEGLERRLAEQSWERGRKRHRRRRRRHRSHLQIILLRGCCDTRPLARSSRAARGKKLLAAKFRKHRGAAKCEGL